MLAVHAFWSSDHGAAVWAEDSESAVTSPSQAVQQARPHPFAAPAATLAGLVDGEAASCTLQLPSLRRSPLDSPEVSRALPRAAGRGVPSLLPWTVPAVRLRPDEIESAIAGLTEDPLDAADIRPAATLRYLADLARYAAELTGRGRLVPAVVEGEAGLRARWRVALTGPDAVAVHALIGAMPPAFRAADAAASPAALVIEALDALADARVRGLLPAALLPPRRGRRPARMPAAEAWVDALTGPDAAIDADPDDAT